MKPLGNDWDAFLQQETQKDYYLQLRQFLKAEYSSVAVYPAMHDIYSALKHTPLGQVKAVILGQDPYINPGEAHGMAFSVLPGAKVPPSLRNIFKELAQDMGCSVPNHGYLMEWAQQGVLLLNTVLTVRQGSSKSHAGKGWEQFTTAVLQQVANKPEPVVYLLWGRDAQTKEHLLINPRHLVLKAAHPSPLAGGRYFGSRHFSQTNKFLEEQGQPPICWQISDIPQTQVSDR